MFNDTGVFKFFRLALAVYLAGQAASLAAKGDSTSDQLVPWSSGTFDIYHFNTGRGDAAYFIFPDGTEMLFDVGDLGEDSLPNHPILKVAEARPNANKQPGEWVADYIKQVRPTDKALKVDYVAISHFHRDHYGNAKARTLRSSSGNFIRTGVTDLGDIIPIATLIDRAYPDYDIPTSLDEHYGETFANYRTFIEEKQKTEGLIVEQLQAGSDQQIRMQYEAPRYPTFRVRNVKSNGAIWSGTGNGIFEYLRPGQIVNEQGKFNENPLSLALTFSYGDFDYFTGGDMTGLQGFGLEPWFDVETPVAKVVGEVDVLTLNHHGNRDASNENFLKALAPRVIVQQSWVSDQPGGEVLHRMVSDALFPGPRDIFSTSMQAETKIAIGTAMMESYRSFEGHVLVRVSPGGHQYQIYVLDDQSANLRVKSVHGPYQAK